MQSIPRVVFLQENELLIQPAHECYMLRKECLGAYAKQEKMDVKGQQIEIELSYRPSEKSVLQIVLQASPDGEERTVLTLD